MAAHVKTPEEDGFWDAVGGTFVAALNDGLARARHSTLRSRSSTRLASKSQELPHPFAAAVMRAFETALPAALAVEDQENKGTQSIPQQRGQEVLAGALGLTNRQGSSATLRAAGPLLPRHENLVVTLLIESAALVLSERPELGGTDGRPAALIRALGRSARNNQPYGRPGGQRYDRANG